MKKKYNITHLLIFCLFAVGLMPSVQAVPLQDNSFREAQRIAYILKQPEEKLNFARIKVTIDKMIDPTIDVNHTLRTIDNMVAEIQSMVNDNASSMDKMLAIKKYLYEKGTWNNHQIYRYDFDDPLGTKIANKMISNYIETKKGNCISMPLLFIILGDKMRLNMTASTAPLHVFVKFIEDETGKTYNLEATSGANITRDIWYRQQMPMTDRAIESGIYLQTLSRKETAVVIANVLAEYYFHENQFEKVIAISDIMLEHYPKYVNTMLRKGSSFYRLLNKEFLMKYPTPNLIPFNEQERFTYLGNGNRYYFSRAEQLGWREPPKDFDEQYLQKIYQDAKKH